MRSLRRFVRRLRASVLRRNDADRVREELAEHVALATDELMRAGVPLDEARRRARLKVGMPDAIAEGYRDERRLRWLEDVGRDTRDGLRSLRRSPGFAAGAILTLALGVGVNSAIFAVVDATLLQPLPFDDPDRLVIVWEQTTSTTRGLTRIANLDEWNRRNRTFAQLAGISPGVGSMVLAHADGTTDTVARQWATGGFFELLGTTPVVGRLFAADDDTAGQDIVVLSEELWRHRFNADPAVVGRTIRLDGLPFTVVGVVPAAFRFAGAPEMWALDRRGGTTLVVGRMKPGVAIEAAAADMAAVATDLASEFPRTNDGRSVLIEPLHEAAVDRDLRVTSWLFAGVVAIILLMCCANVANLLLARGAARTRELAIRSALGASRRRIVQQMLTESCLLSVLGGLLGAGIGALLLDLAPRMIPVGMLPPTVSLAFDARVFAFCAIVAGATGLLFGMAPARQATGVSPVEAAGESRTVAGGDGRLRALLMTAQIAAAVVLLFGAGLLVRTLIAVASVDRGYRATNVLTMIVDPPANEYATPESMERFYAEVGSAVRALPDVENAAWATTLPFGRSFGGPTPFAVADAPPLDELDRPTADDQVVSTQYFRTMDLPVVLGRAFNEQDTRTSEAVCMINEAIARRFFPNRSPIGVPLQVGATIRTVVGVARQVKSQPDEAEELLQIYSPLSQNVPGDAFLLVQSSSGAAAFLGPSVRAVISRIDKAQVVSVREVQELEDVVAEAASRQRFRAVLAATFAALAAVLAAVGLFGLIAYSTQQRRRDFGVRRALGATTANIVRIVAGEAVHVALRGAVVGLLLSAALARTIDNLLFGVESVDPATIGLVLVALIALIISASIVPALRATRIDPAAGLRGD